MYEIICIYVFIVNFKINQTIISKHIIYSSIFNIILTPCDRITKILQIEALSPQAIAFLDNKGCASAGVKKLFQADEFIDQIQERNVVQHLLSLAVTLGCPFISFVRVTLCCPFILRE